MTFNLVALGCERIVDRCCDTRMSGTRNSYVSLLYVARDPRRALAEVGDFTIDEVSRSFKSAMTMRTTSSDHFLTEYVQRTLENGRPCPQWNPSRTAESTNQRTRVTHAHRFDTCWRIASTYRTPTGFVDTRRPRRIRLESFITVASRCQGAVTLVPAPQRHYNGVQLRIQKSVDILFGIGWCFPRYGSSVARPISCEIITEKIANRCDNRSPVERSRVTKSIPFFRSNWISPNN